MHKHFMQFDCPFGTRPVPTNCTCTSVPVPVLLVNVPMEYEPSLYRCSFALGLALILVESRKGTYLQKMTYEPSPVNFLVLLTENSSSTYCGVF